MDESANISTDQVKEWSFARDLLQTKTDNWIAYLDLAESQIAMADAQLKRVQAQKKAKESVLKGLHSYLCYVLSNTEGRAIRGTDGEISLVKNPPSLKINLETQKFSSDVILTGEQINLIPEEFVRTMTLKILDKALLKNALKADLDVPYAELVCSERIKIK
jgi:hypothetical protein